MKKQFATLLLFSLILMIVSFNFDCSFIQASTSPIITSISPNPFYEGEMITINGENFGNKCSTIFENHLIFNDVSTYQICGDWTDNKIAYDTFLGGESGYIQIQTAEGSFSNKFDVVVLQRNPTILSIAPQEIYPGSFITVYGNNFGATDPGSSYQFYLNGQHVHRANISSWTDGSFKMYIENKITPGDYELQIKLNDERYSNKINFTILDSCTEDEWNCDEWGECLANGKQERTCEKTFDCPSINTPSPATIQSCTYTPSCTKDTWQCGSWGACSPQGIQTRSCDKTYDCSSAETASPATSQYCEVSNKPDQNPSDDLGIVNQDSIIKASVKLICPVSSTMASQGSGTVISSDGTILTNKHVVDGTAGCLVGFINNYDDEPYFNDRQIADIHSISSDSDIAILKLRNPYSRNLTAINITGSNSNNLSLGDQITTYGYPAKFGRKITYTSGDFSGVDGNYLKTTAIIEFGNSGGGAYLKNGTFIGIPSAVMKGELNSLGYILSVNKINSWLNNSPIAHNGNGNNNYSRVSILDEIDLNTLSSLDLFIADENGEVADGDIIQCQNSSNPSAVYIVKIIGDTKYIRHIVSLDIFNYYTHLKWENLKQVNSLDDYSLFGWVRYNTGPNRTAGPTDKVYEINGDQTIHWINMTAEDFLTHGGSEPAIFNINQGELNLYTAGADVMSL